MPYVLAVPTLKHRTPMRFVVELEVGDPLFQRFLT